MNAKCITTLELDKILTAAANFAVLDGGKTAITSCVPSTSLARVKQLLSATVECDKLLYTYGVGKIGYFPPMQSLIQRAQKGFSLSCAELLDCAALLRSARTAYESVSSVRDDGITIIRDIADKIYFSRSLEDDITEKIISVDQVSDRASEKLFSVRSRIRSLNEKIRARLSEYLSEDAAYLQDGIVTIRNDRFVIPVKAEYKNRVRGFIHDRSQSGATFFIEPEQVLEMNNELVALALDEKQEVEAVLRELSARVGDISAQLSADEENLCLIDSFYARAEYAYSVKGVCPSVNDRGYINIVQGRHPLLDAKSTVPVSVELGNKYGFLILSGANTGGKTVTLKMCGLFCLMAACGLFLPASEGTAVAVFDKVFCDIGDSQSIEENLSTFSSHLLNVAEICKQANSRSLALIDELGGGTNPDEGQALAKAVVKALVKRGCKGIVTTHFTPLKEFAYTLDGVENASMEFDSATLKPLYSIKIGLPGASNALAISKRLGLDEDIIADAVSYLSEGARSFENVVSRAEQSRVQAEETLARAKNLEREWNEKVKILNSQIAQLNAERERLNRNAGKESRRIISERTARAEEILADIEEIFGKEELTRADLVKARTLKNRLSDIAYEEEGASKASVNDYAQADKNNLKAGARVFVKKMQTEGTVTSYVSGKSEAEVLCGNIKMHCKPEELLLMPQPPQKPAKKVKLVSDVVRGAPKLEINLLGMTVEEALYELDNFIDKAVTDNLEEIKVIHGVGTGALRKAIAEHLKRHRNVESFRAGKYGEGETGVTIIKLR